MRTSEPTAFSHLLEDYCRSVGMGDLEVDSEGGVFEIDDVTVLVRHDEDFDRLSLTAAVDTVDTENIAQLAPLLLELNAALARVGGMAFSVDVESGEVQIEQSLPLQTTGSDQLDAELANLVEKCRTARPLLAALRSAPPSTRPLGDRGANQTSHLMVFRA